MSLAVTCGLSPLLRNFNVYMYISCYFGCLHCYTVSLQRNGVLEGDGAPGVWSRVDGVDPDWRAQQEPSDVGLHYAALIRRLMLFN